MSSEKYEQSGYGLKVSFLVLNGVFHNLGELG